VDDQRKQPPSAVPARDAPLIAGVDYYWQNSLMVFTEAFLRRRGYCCRSGCRHCPYGFVANAKDNEGPA
jgi:hypothetical protein